MNAKGRLSMNLKSNRGMSLVGVLVGAAIAAVGLIFFIRSSKSVQVQARHLHERVVAEAYATELLEFLRSHEDIVLDDYLSRNPFLSGVSCPASDPDPCPYKLCSHINIIDRATGNIINRDDIAALPDDPNLNPLFRSEAALKPNRWYQVQVVNLASPVTQGTGGCPAGPKDCGRITVRTDLCANGTDEIKFPGQAGAGTALSSSETFMITVGVSWFPRDIQNPDVTQDVKRVVLTSVIPSNRT
jgi:hypothetical protein